LFDEKDGLVQREESDFRVAISDLIRLLSRGLGNSMKQSQENASALTRSGSDFKIYSFQKHRFFAIKNKFANFANW